ncbi:unnamed protein product [Soboliphyme baturini]|uniref:BTP domain-containing protein n=1 Tax=Soboliphyme baturini TaxID=241478 RepID=A0A183J3G8_9BILA|nr:unnamed protein product [Soboliphyme baturini]
MSDQFALGVLKVSLAIISQNIGFHSTSRIAFRVLVEVLNRRLQTMCQSLASICQHCGRTQPIFDDLLISFSDLGISVESVLEFMEQVGPIPYPRKVRSIKVVGNVICDSWEKLIISELVFLLLASCLSRCIRDKFPLFRMAI